MPYTLEPHMTCCLVADQVILLDIKANEYLSVSAKENAALLRWASGPSPSIEDEDILARLAGTGIIRATREPAPLSPCRLPSVEASLLDDPPVDYRPHHLAQAILAQCEAALVLRAGAIDGAIRYLRRTRAHRTAGAHVATIAATTWATMMAQAIVPSHDKCLRRSLGLALLLARAGHSGQLVFGVKLNTFSAHAWVQVGDLVLNDAVDEVTRYTPILAV